MCPNEDTAKKIYNIIGRKLQLSLEDEPPLEYFCLIKDFNGININQTQEYIQVNCPDYIDRVLKSHKWDTTQDIGTRPLAPLPEEAVHKMYTEVLSPLNGGPREGTAEHIIPDKKIEFSYISILGELMYAYVICCPDISYNVITLSKFSTCPTRLHYTYLQGVVTYLSRTKKCGIRFHHTCL